MPISPFRKVRTNDKNLRQIQDAVELPIKDISNRQILDGVLLEDITLVSGQPNYVDHKLGRKIRGWFVVRLTADATIYDQLDDDSFNEFRLVLQTSATCRVSLWVF